MSQEQARSNVGRSALAEERPLAIARLATLESIRAVNLLSPPFKSKNL